MKVLTEALPSKEIHQKNLVIFVMRTQAFMSGFFIADCECENILDNLFEQAPCSPAYDDSNFFVFDIFFVELAGATTRTIYGAINFPRDRDVVMKVFIPFLKKDFNKPFVYVL